MPTVIRKKSLILILAVLAVVFSIVYFSETARKEEPKEFVIAQRGTFVQEVSLTGRVKPATDTDLAFDRSGIVEEVYSKVGSKVRAGEILIMLQNDDLQAQFLHAQAGVEIAQAQMNQYKAALDVEKAKLAELKKGVREEEIKISQINLDNAKKAFADAETNLQNVKTKAENDLSQLYDDVKDTLQDAFVKADDAVNKQVNDLFREENGVPRLIFTVADSTITNTAEVGKISASQEVLMLKNELEDFPLERAEIDAEIIKASEHLSKVRIFLNNMDDALEESLGIASAALTTYKGYVNTGRTNVNTALTSITTAQQAISAQKVTNQNNISAAEAKVNDAKNLVSSREAELSLKETGTAKEQIKAQEARVKQAQAVLATQAAYIKQAQANMQSISAQIERTYLFSAIDGIITKFDVKQGEMVTAGKMVVSVMSDAKFEITADVAEVDVVKLDAGDAAGITLDPYGDDVKFEAKLTEIDPAETMIEGVPTYKTTFQFVKDDDRIKSGMTANIDIVTEQKEDVISIPQRVLIMRDGDRFVKILDGATEKEVKVVTGIRGAESNVEILEGLQEGDRVLLPTTR